MKIRQYSLIAMFAGLAGVAGCAALPSDSPGMTDATQKLVVTGSRIPREVDPEAEILNTAAPVTVITKEELDRTGEIDLKRALRKASPIVD